jgi:hypothetical protein
MCLHAKAYTSKYSANSVQRVCGYLRALRCWRAMDLPAEICSSVVCGCVHGPMFLRAACGRNPHGLFVPNDSDQVRRLRRANDGNRRKLAAEQHCSINFPRSSPTADERENVPICVLGLALIAAVRVVPRHPQGGWRLSPNETTWAFGVFAPLTATENHRSER